MTTEEFEKEVTQNYEEEVERVRKQLPLVCEGAAVVMAWANLVNRKVKTILGSGEEMKYRKD